MPRFFRLLLSLLFGGTLALPGRAQQPPAPDAERVPLYASYAAFADTLAALTARPAGADRDAALDAFWQQLRDAHQVPFAHGEQVAFLYRGSVASVEWRGDFNGWGSGGALRGRRLGDTDLWLAETTFPADARIDYKIVRNGNDWILDPANPLRMWSGFGPNAELRMPAYQYPHDTIRRPGIARGTFTANQRIRSTALGYDVHYRVYTPAGYDTLTAALPVLYVTDGHEYAADHMGSLVAVLDNLIDEGRIAPVMAVFIDPREVGRTGNNRRQAQYVANDAFVAFVSDELVPAVDAAYRTRTDAAGRAILGTSLGGLNSAYFGVHRPDVFGKIAIQSPAFWIHEAIYAPYQDGAGDDLEIFLTVGTIRDGDGGSRLHAILEGRGVEHFYREVNEGHSWGNWRALLDDLLTYFWPADAATGRHQTPRAPAPSLHAAPNPFHQTTVLHLDVPAAQHGSLHVYDALGRRVATLLRDAYLTAGRHTFAVDASRWPSGPYHARLHLEHGSAVGHLVHLR